MRFRKLQQWYPNNTTNRPGRGRQRLALRRVRDGGSAAERSRTLANGCACFRRKRREIDACSGIVEAVLGSRRLVAKEQCTHPAAQFAERDSFVLCGSGVVFLGDFFLFLFLPIFSGSVVAESMFGFGHVVEESWRCLLDPGSHRIGKRVEKGGRSSRFVQERQAAQLLLHGWQTAEWRNICRKDTNHSFNIESFAIPMWSQHLLPT